MNPILIPGDKHQNWMRWETWCALIKATADFLKKHLMDLMLKLQEFIISANRLVQTTNDQTNSNSDKPILGLEHLQGKSIEQKRDSFKARFGFKWPNT